MTERPTLAIGLMSGTSLDGVDAALVRFEGPTHCDLVHFITRPYAAAERDQILSAIAAGGGTGSGAAAYPPRGVVGRGRRGTPGLGPHPGDGGLLHRHARSDHLA